MTSAVSDYIQQFVFNLRASRIPFSQVILFGSYAKGKTHAWSDLDLCVVSDVFGEDFQKETILLTKLLPKGDMPVDIIPYSINSFSDKYDPLAKEIRETGVLVS